MYAMVIHHNEDDRDEDTVQVVPPLAPPLAPAGTYTHAPMYTAQVSPDVIMTVIRVDNASYQLYAVSDGTWDLVGLYDLYVDALTNIDMWRQYLQASGTLAAWRKANPYGVQPNTMMVADRGQ